MEEEEEEDDDDEGDRDRYTPSGAQLEIFSVGGDMPLLGGKHGPTRLHT